MTELIWQGKYDKEDRKTAPIRIALPFQKIETVNESAQERQRTLDLFSQGKQTDWRNRLIWGDKKYVLPSLLPEFAGKVDLIYIDPPFDTGADFSFKTKIPESDAQFTKQPSVIEQKAYRDTWGKGLDSYLQWFYETIVLLHELLAETGSIYVHLDWHVGHYAKIIMDEIFGIKNLQNEIIWGYRTQGATKRRFSRKHDTLMFYTRTQHWTFNCLTERSYMQHKYGFSDKDFKIDEEGRQYRDAIVRDVWEISAIQSATSENLGFPTQKPEALLERIIKASSNEGDLVLDSFVGSGTTAAVAEKLRRRWIACDLSKFAIHTTRKRLLSIEGVKPFVVQNLGKYERQAWMTAEFEAPEDNAARQQAYRNFILELYHATPINGYRWLHGVRAGQMVHVGSVEAPITIGDAKGIVTEFWKSVGKNADAKTNGVDILGWEFAFELNEVAKQIAAEANVNIAFKKIPREVLDKRAVEQGDIRFFELAALSVDVKINKKEATLKLTDFVIPPDDVPEDVQQAITHWSQWIDYWAVDWDFKDDTFHNQWQSYRTKKEPDLQKEVTHTYDEAGVYAVVVKVIDILGNDTTKVMEVELT